MVRLIKRLNPILLAILGLLLMALPIYAIDVGGATYRADVVVTNTNAATTNVCVPFTVNTQALVDNNYVTSDLKNTALQTPGGTDIPYSLARVSTNTTWMMFVSSIDQNAMRNYNLYLGGDPMQDHLVYFPGTSGMTTNDSATLELGDNFIFEQKGWIDTTAGSNKNLLFKDEALRIYVSDSGSISVAFHESGESTFYPDAHEETSSVDGYASHHDAVGTWAAHRGGAGTASNDNGATTLLAFIEASGGNWWTLARGLLLFDTSSLGAGAEISAATLSLYGSSKTNTSSWSPEPDINIYSSAPASNTAIVAGDFDSLGTTAYCDTPITYTNFSVTGYNDFAFNATGIAAIVVDGVSKFGTRNANYDAANIEPSPVSDSCQFNCYAADQAGTDKDPKLVVTYINWQDQVTATGISSGEHTIKVTADGTNLKIYVDDVEKDSVALDGASVPNNDNNWTFLQNDVMPYMDYHKIWVSGTLKQHIVWENSTTFSDLSENNHGATPTFRTTSSDPDVSAALDNLQPIEEAELVGYETDEAPEMVSEAPLMPPEMYTEGEVEHLPGAELVNDLLEHADIPLSLFWFPFFFGIAVIAGMGAWHMSRSLMIEGAVADIVLWFFGLTIAIPLWPAIVLIVIIVGVVVARKTISL